MNKNLVWRFIFDKLPIRGAYVELTDVWQTIAAQKDYPEGIRQLLGELLVANILMTTNIKLNGKITAQIQDNPKLNLVVSECSNDLQVRATAKFDAITHKDNQVSYTECVTRGSLIISIDSQTEGKLYQSVVPLSGQDLTTVLNDYMLQSEQLCSIFVLAYTDTKIVGFMLQQLPDPNGEHIEDMERVFLLAQTLSKTELLHDEIAIILHKLFNEDDIVLFDPQPATFSCTCSRDKVTNMLRILGKEEAQSIINEQGSIKVTCDFCNTAYEYDANDVELMFSILCFDMESISQEFH
jgi:molecular chaperone Hsp33